ncbi:H-NS histone family protein [Aquincola sp. S2]|uniref:H-NS histone family protein n=1 Tax=Pseudaquabacterium terrae TaxID=2732868 RepID=A0ABX2ERM9_9BURK|nr:H-NS family nucleoid-associated regulatory protein [Aquabacterium terrae]NRF71385.1 H-NS histone family protein [Aquabacterium terrae]
MTTLHAISAQIAKLQAQAEALRETEKAGVVARIREAIAVYDISAQMLGFGGGKGRREGGAAKRQAVNGSSVGVPKYKDPATGNTWTGRGKPPAWIAGAKDRSALLINGSAGAPAAKAEGGARAKAKATPKVGVPKYADPASGKTWTGRGKPPAWIAGVQNRDAFLIAK